MKSTKSLFAILALLLISTLACSIGGGKSLDILFEDDFSDTDSGWDRHSDDVGSMDYYDDQYRIYVYETEYDIWATPFQDFGDVIVEVNTSKISGSDDNNFGIICKYVDTDRFYMLLISSDGYYAIQKMTVDGYERLSGEFFEESSAINLGNSENTLKAECVGGRLALYVNGTLVGEVYDYDYTSGDVGLLAGSFSEANVEILFDDFVVSKPE